MTRVKFSSCIQMNEKLSMAKQIAYLIFVLAAALPLGTGLEECKYEIVESMPDGLVLNETTGFRPARTHETLISLANGAKRTMKIASFYWTLNSEPGLSSNPSTSAGREVMSAITAAANRGVELQVLLDHSSRKEMNNREDIKKLEKLGSVKYLNMSHLLHAGVMHSKFMIVDSESFYVGSSNFDWRSYTQIKEIGISFQSCKVLAEDIEKIFKTYSMISDLGKIPDNVPDDLKTTINMGNPHTLSMDGRSVKIFLGGAPPAFNGIKEWTGRTDDIDGLLHIIDSARRQVDISVMNYSPRTEFIWPKKFWPRIDNALRRAASERQVSVRLLFSNWTNTKDEELMWYRSLNAVQSKTLGKGGIHVRLFKVPAFDEFQKKVPYARVKHDKYLVTDKGLYIGTSNWSPDYFINTCGVSVVIEPSDGDSVGAPVIANMRNLFDRDFKSKYAADLA